ncbi:MAG: hypothetical protein UW28_C0043G0009, partial [Parcubacteria group bacterium GW2011_GWA2_44_13]
IRGCCKILGAFGGLEKSAKNSFCRDESIFKKRLMSFPGILVDGELFSTG